MISSLGHVGIVCGDFMQGFSRPIDFQKESDEELLAFSKSFEATQGPFQGAKLPVG